MILESLKKNYADFSRVRNNTDVKEIAPKDGGKKLITEDSLFSAH